MSNVVTGVGRLPIPKLTLVVTVVIIGVFYVLGQASDDFIYQKYKIIDGQVWRLVTGHFIHCDLEHLVWNIIAFMALGSFLENRDPDLLLNSFIAGVLGISMWLVVDSNILFYCGLSGVLNSMFVVVMFLIWQDTKHPVLLLVLFGYIIKLVLEIITTNSVLTDIAWKPLPMAHIVGMFSGVVCMFVGDCELLRNVKYKL